MPLCYCRLAIHSLLLLTTAAVAAADEADFFAERVAPLLQQRCLSCHSAAVSKGEFSLTDSSNLRDLGYIDTSDPDSSYLLQLVTPQAGQAEMPRDGQPLTATEIAVLRQWIADGAVWPAGMRLDLPEVKDRDWWSSRPIVRPAVPESRADHPIDAFIEAEQRRRQLTPVPLAEPLTLVRRLTYDLTGLPPTPSEVDAYLAQAQVAPERAWTELVERLLNSPAFGEKWARAWLDAARYAETHGYDKDKPRQHAWPYRDYVIRSFNEDKSYARFVQEQVAGDVLFPAEPDGVLGLGFLAAGPWDFIGHWEVGEGKLDGRIAKHLDRDEMLSAVFNVFQSTTVQCAQCHHHKFDPIRMEDYYRLHAVFAAVDRADRDIASLPAAEQERKQMLLARRQELLAERERLKEQQQPLKEIQTQLASVESALSQIPAPPQVFAVTTHFSGGGQFKPTEGRPREIRLLHRGDLTSPGDLVSPGAPQLWEAAEDEFFPPARFSVARPWLEGEARAELARYLTAADNPLVWRSIANRLWGWTFGTPLVGTLNDFGRGGMQPTHPQLLDYLAAELRDDPRQSLKSIIRLLVTSRTYRRSSRSDEHSAQIDAGNAYLWRANRRRLTAEEFRDSLLAASGILNRQAGGQSFRDFVIDKPDHSPHYEYHLHDPADTATHRRSIYRFVVRSQPHPLLTTLDCADPSISFPRRDESTTALQALAAWNNRFVEYTARKLAERMERHGLKSVEQIDFACRQVLGRGATPRERALLEEHLNAHGSASVARVLFNMNAFFYLD